MKKITLFSLLLFLSVAAKAQNTVIDISGDNTSSSYVSYNQSINIAVGRTVDVKMARYCYFSSTITGSGTLNLYGGGERCYLGTSKGASWANWSGFKGDIHIFPFKENSSSAGAYGVLLAHGGKRFSPENIENATVNDAMVNNHVTLHQGATMTGETNSNGSGFRIGELQTEAGSTLQGYYKTGRPVYYLLGALNSDATLAGTVKSTGYDDATLLGIIKEGSGTYRITGNDNYLSGALRVLAGRVLVNNDRAEAEKSKKRGALGARPNESDAIAYVFEKGVLGGTGSIGGTVDNYGTIEPGDDAVGTLTIQNYVTPTKNANLLSRPASVLRFKIGSTTDYDRLVVGGVLKYSNMAQDFSTSDKMPVIQLQIADGADVRVGDELTLLTAKSKSGDWHFDLKKPEKFTWELEERTVDGKYMLVLRLVSLEAENPDNPDNPDDPDTPESTMGAYYDDGINDATDTKTLRYYAEKNNKLIGAAFCTYKGYDSDRNEGGRQFSLLEPENEMKMDALQPNRGGFTYGSADALVSFAQRNNMKVRGHCLVWHMQQPGWVSSDGKKNDKNWSRTEALAIMKDHITNVMQHFKGKVTEWDVVNECLDDDQSIVRSDPDGFTLRQTVWERAIGKDYIDSAFVYAHRADPDALLYLNDYKVELQGTAKAVAYYNLVKKLQSRNIPIDGVGLQCHFSIGDVDSVKLEKTIRRFGESDLKCVITELDMGVSSTASANLEEQARNYRVITDVMLNNDNCPYMIVWGLKDNDSWRSAESPLLYNSGMGKKPAWYAVRSALRHRQLPSTSLGSLAADESAADTSVYSLMGHKLNAPLRPGLYVRSGQKFVVR